MLNIYLTDLSAYNSGALVGKWITLPCDELELHTAINEVLIKGEEAVKGFNHEEYFITDYEWEELGFFEVDEYENIFSLNANLVLLMELPKLQQKAVRFLLSEFITYDIEDAILKSEDVIVHENTTLEDYAYEFIDEIYNIDSLPSIIANNIDYEGVARELEYEGIYHEIDDDLYEYIG